MFISDDTYLNMNSTYGRNAYIWAKDIFAPDDQIKEWNNAYLRTYVANVVLDGLGEGSGPESERNILRGEGPLHPCNSFVHHHAGILCSL